MIQINRPLRDRDGERRKGRPRGGANLSGAAATSFNREFHVNDITAHDAPDQLIVVDGEGLTVEEFGQRVSARLAQFAEPPHITDARAKIAQIREHADVQREDWRIIARRWDHAMVIVAVALFAMMAIRLAWAWHTGAFPG